MYRVVVADAYPVICRGLHRYLSGLGDMTVVADAAGTADLVELVAQHAAQVVIVDPWQTTGVTVLKRLTAVRPPVGILVFTGHEEPSYVQHALSAGAFGYVSKARPLQEVATAIRRVAQGLTYLSAPFETVDLPVTPPRLSRREAQVFTLLGQGITLADIADQLRLSPKTITTYEEGLKAKLNVDSLHEVKYAAMRQQIRPDPPQGRNKRQVSHRDPLANTARGYAAEGITGEGGTPHAFLPGNRS